MVRACPKQRSSRRFYRFRRWLRRHHRARRVRKGLRFDRVERRKALFDTLYLRAYRRLHPRPHFRYISKAVVTSTKANTVRVRRLPTRPLEIITKRAPFARRAIAHKKFLSTLRYRRSARQRPDTRCRKLLLRRKLAKLRRPRHKKQRKPRAAIVRRLVRTLQVNSRHTRGRLRRRAFTRPQRQARYLKYLYSVKRGQ